MIFWFPQLTLNGRLAGIDWLHFWRKNENWLKNGRSRGWAVSGAGWSSQISWSGQPAPETAQPLDLPFLSQSSFFLQKWCPHMLAHLPFRLSCEIQKFVKILLTLMSIEQSKHLKNKKTFQYFTCICSILAKVKYFWQSSWIVDSSSEIVFGKVKISILNFFFNSQIFWIAERLGR